MDGTSPAARKHTLITQASTRVVARPHTPALAGARVIADAPRESETVVGDTPLYEPPPLSLVRSIPASPPLPVTGPADAELLAILEAPLANGASAMTGFANKEIALRDAITALPVLEARTLHLRLSNPRSEDVLAQRFSRLTGERRNRLLAFIADARRREALAAGTRR